MNYTEQFVQRLDNVVQNIGETEISQVKKCLLDYIGVAFAGSTKMPATQDVLLKKFPGAYFVVGKQIQTDFAFSLQYNAFAAHILELDDGHRAGMIHLGSPIFTSLLVVLQNHNISFGDFAKGVVAGYEAAIRLARSIQPSHKLMGFHATGTCGCIGCAVSIAYALGYTFQEKVNVISAAATSAGGLLEVITGYSQQKPFNVSQAALSGSMAALFGISLRAPEDVLGGERGFVSNFSEEAKTEMLTEELEPQILGCYFKPYAACRHCHAPIEAGLKLHNKVNANDIARVKVTTYKLAVKGHDHTKIDGINSSKMSIPYSIAVALLLGDGSEKAYTEELINESRLKKLTESVQVVENPELSKLVPNKRVAIVDVFLKNGSVLTERVDYPLGEPENPLTMEALAVKYNSLMSGSNIPQEKAESLWNTISDIDKNDNITKIIEIIKA